MTSRPALGNITPGTPVIVSVRRYRGTENINATVTAAARVWLTIAEDGDGPRTWRMRRDTQATTADNIHLADRFATIEQHEWDQRLTAADRFLFDAGIQIRSSFPWRKPDRRIQLADMIRAADTQED